MTSTDEVWQLRRENSELRALCGSFATVIDRYRTVLAILGRGPDSAQTRLANAELATPLPRLVQLWLEP